MTFEKNFTNPEDAERIFNEAALNEPAESTTASTSTSSVTSEAAPAPGVLTGGHLTRVRVSDPSSPTRTSFRWYQIYEWPRGSKQFLAYQFNDVEQVLATYGGELPFYRTWEESGFNRAVVGTASAEEVIGRSGNFQILTEQIMREAALAAGVRDPGLVGRIASNPEMQRIMAQATVGEWTEAQIKAAQRSTSFWKNELYPGIEAFYDMTDNPEGAYRDYLNNASPYLAQLGYEKGADGTYKNQVQRMLNNRVDLGTFIQMVPVYERAVQNIEFAGVFNEWAERELGRQIEFGDWFDLQAGEPAPELEAVAEKATLQWVAENQGSAVSQQQIESLAARSQLSEIEARRAFSEFNQSVLALGDQGLKKYGLNRDEVLSVAAGVAPASGRSIEEVQLLIAKTAREQALADDEKINFYVGFNQDAQPTRPGLASLTPEGA